MGSFLQCEESLFRESELAAQYRLETLKREEIARTQNVQMLAEKTKQDAKQKLLQKKLEEQQHLETRIRNELSDFMKQRAEQRRLYQAKKLSAQLSDFWEQRAQARREYRAAQQSKLG